MFRAVPHPSFVPTRLGFNDLTNHLHPRNSLVVIIVSILPLFQEPRSGGYIRRLQKKSYGVGRGRLVELGAAMAP